MQTIDKDNGVPVVEYEAPQIEVVFTPQDLEREVAYAGLIKVS